MSRARGGRLTRRATLALVTPSFEDIGGVGTVADFLLRVLAERPDYAVRIISLATWTRDPASLLLMDPRTWARGAVAVTKRARGYEHQHVGAVLGELEVRRLAPRRALTAALADCDLIQVVAGVPAWANPVLGLGKPVLLQTATLTTVERRTRASAERGAEALWRGTMTRAVARLDERALREVDVVQVENPWMFDHARAVARERAVKVVHAPPGIDLRRFRPALDGDPAPSKPYFLAVGRFSDPRKNPMLLLAAYVAFARTLDDAPELVLAGALPPPATFWEAARGAGLAEKVRFIDNPTIEALASLYRYALGLVLPSDEEGLGLVMIEAMASGAPVIATRCGGPEGVIRDGVDGWLVDRGDASAMADRMRRLCASPDRARQMGQAALATARERYSDAAAGKVYLDLYDQILGF